MKFFIFTAFLPLAIHYICARADPDILPNESVNGYPRDAQVVIHCILDAEPPSGSDFIVRFGVLNNVPDDPTSRPVFGYDISKSTTAVPIPTYLVVCQAFADTEGKYALGAPFIQAQFGTGLFSNYLVSVGSIFCSDAAAVDAYVNSRPANGEPIVRAVPRPYVDISLFRSDPTPDIEQGVLTDGSVALITLPFDERIARIVDASGVELSHVSCQLYANEEGTTKFGLPFTNASTFYEGYNVLYACKVKAVRCKIVGDVLKGSYYQVQGI